MIEGPVQIYGRLDVGGAREYPEAGSIPAYKKIYQLEPNDRQRKRRQRTSETVAGIVPYESSLAEHELKFPEARGRHPICNSS